MASKVEICNRALAFIGQTDFIVDITENTAAAKLCNSLFDGTRDAILRSYPWNFAMRRATLSLSATSPDWEYTNAFDLPAGCLRVFKVEDSSLYPWRIENGQLLTDNGAAKILYVIQVTDTGSFDPLFSDLLAAKLAAEIAYPLTGSRSLSNDAYSLFGTKIIEARLADAQEGINDAIQADEWLNARL